MTYLSLDLYISVSFQDVFSLVPAAEIRALREENPSNLATLCFKAVGKLEHAAHNGAQTQKEQEARIKALRVKEKKNQGRKHGRIKAVTQIMIRTNQPTDAEGYRHRLAHATNNKTR